MFEITRWILGWGDAAEVVKPPALRKEVAAMVKRATEAYSQISRPEKSGKARRGS
jgi:predicted DNA-binding transcriptional regulator YafY